MPYSVKRHHTDPVHTHKVPVLPVWVLRWYMVQLTENKEKSRYSQCVFLVKEDHCQIHHVVGEICLRTITPAS